MKIASICNDIIRFSQQEADDEYSKSTKRFELIKAKKAITNELNIMIRELDIR